jgi:hypothetical protein
MALTASSSDDEMDDPLFNPLAAAPAPKGFSSAVVGFDDDAFESAGLSNASNVSSAASSPPKFEGNYMNPLEAPPPPPKKDDQPVVTSAALSTASGIPAVSSPSVAAKPTGPCCATASAISKWLQVYPTAPADAGDPAAEKRNMVVISDSQKVG